MSSKALPLRDKFFPKGFMSVGISLNCVRELIAEHLCWKLKGNLRLLE